MLILAKFSCFWPLKRPLVDFFDLISYSAMSCSYTNSLTAIFTSFLESVTQNIRKYPKIAHFSVYFFLNRPRYGPLEAKFFFARETFFKNPQEGLYQILSKSIEPFARSRAPKSVTARVWQPECNSQSVTAWAWHATKTRSLVYEISHFFIFTHVVH